MSDPVETYQVGRCQVEIHLDDDARSPYEDCEMLGKIAHWHRRYNFGGTDNRISDPREFLMGLAREKISSNYPESLFEKNWEKILDTHYLVLPLSLLDHSGLHIWVGSGEHWSDPGGWDSGQVGFIYVSLEECRKNWLKPKAGWGTKIEWRNFTQAKIDAVGKIITPYSFAECKITMREAAREVLEGEIKEYDLFLSGECYGYVVSPESGEDESCWGFLGEIGYVKQEAYSVAEAMNARMDEEDRVNAITAKETGLAEVWP